MKVAELMTKPAQTCKASDTLERAAQIMWESDCGAVAVVNDDGQTIGVLTDRDVCMCAYLQGKPLSDIPVTVATSRSLVSVHPDDALDLAQVLMESARIRRLPVVDGDGHPLGLIGLGDMARHMANAPRPNGLSADGVARTLAAVSQPHAARHHPEHGRVYRVRYNDGTWRVFAGDGEVASGRIDSLSNAVIHAKELARRDGSAQILVYDTDDHLRSEFVYQRDERSSLSTDDSVASLAASGPAHAG